MAWFPFLERIQFRRELLNEVPGYADNTWRHMSALAANALDNMHHASQSWSWIVPNLFPNDALGGQTWRYSSYPQGFLFLPLLLRKIFVEVPTNEILFWISVANMVFFGILAGIIAGLAAKKMCDNRWIWFGALIFTPISLMTSYHVYVFFPGVWWPDIAGLSCVAVLVVWFLVRDPDQWPVAIPIVDVTLCFFTAWTDWYGLITVSVFIWITRRERRAYFGFIGLSAALMLYLIPIFFLGDLTVVGTKFLQRSVYGARTTPLDIVPFTARLGRELGVVGSLVMVCALFLSLKRQKWVILLLVPTLLHSILFLEHYRGHPYEWIKWCFVSAVFLPGAVCGVMVGRFKPVSSYLTMALMVFVAAQGIHLTNYLKPLYKSYVASYSNAHKALCREVIDVAEREGAPGIFIAASPGQVEEYSYLSQRLCRVAFIATTDLDLVAPKPFVILQDGAGTHHLNGLQFHSQVEQWKIFVRRKDK